MVKQNKKAGKKKRNDDLQRWGVIIVGALFILSMASFAINSGSDRQTSSVVIPEDNIIYGNITEAQRQLIVYYGGTVVDYSYPSDCGMECFQTKTALESLAGTYTPYLFVVYSEGGDDMAMTVSNYYGSENVDNLSAVEDNVCDVLISIGHQACMERRAMDAVFAKNESTIADVDESDDLVE